MSLNSLVEEQSVGLLGNMEAREENMKMRQYQTLYSLTTSLGIGLLILELFWLLHYRGGFAWQSQPSLEFNWHPFLMVLGMVFLYSQSILVYRTIRNSPKKSVKLLHMVLHLLAFIISVIGLKAVFDSHNLATPPTANLYSLHSWIGLITVIVFSAQFLSGFLTFLYPGLATSLRKALLPIHTAFGTSCFILALISTTTGLTEKVIWTLILKVSSNTAKKKGIPPELFQNILKIIVLNLKTLMKILPNGSLVWDTKKFKLPNNIKQQRKQSPFLFYAMKIFLKSGNNYGNLVPEGIVFNFIGVFAVLYGVLVLYLVNNTDYKRVAAPEDEIGLASSH